MRLAGRVETPYVDSTILQGNYPADPVVRMLPIYLPPSYDHTSSRRFPVIYLLAGHGGSGPFLLARRPWEESVPERIDRLIRSGVMDEVICVLPDCWTVFGGSQYLNSTALGDYESYLSEEIISYVDANYRTVPQASHRAIVGKSSGGYGAMVQSMRHPDLWGAVASHSGDIYFEFGYLPDVATLHANLHRYGGIDRFIEAIPTIKPRVHQPFYSVLGMLCYSAAYSPNPSAHRGFDLPIDSDTGALNGEVWERWLAWDPLRLLNDPCHIDAWRGLSYLYIDCGNWDELNFNVGTRVLAHKLERLGIEADVEFFDDGHLDVSYRLDISLPRLAQAVSQHRP